MTKLEKVIKGLECCTSSKPLCHECPFYKCGDTCGSTLMRLALILIRPRKLPLEEVAACGVPMWLRNKPNSDYDGWVMFSAEQRPYYKFGRFDGARIMLSCDRYGDEWECWTGEVTDGD